MQSNLLEDNLNNKIAIVTGGGRGIGKAICITLAEKGAKVVVADKDVKSAEETAKSLCSERGCGVEVDVSSEESILKLYAYIKEHFGRVDILVNNAGISKTTPIFDMTAAEWDMILAVNLRGAFLMGREALRLMKAQQSGRIINIASLSAKTGGIAAGAHYSASKAGLVCFTKSLALQSAEFGICVNAITPGFIETDLTRAWGKEKNASLIEKIPLKKFGQPQDVAEVVAFLASQRGRYITGEIIDVNGGIWMD